MKYLISYKSKTGFTKKYAEWIHEKVGGDLRNIDDIKSSDIPKYDLVIHGGWIMAGRIKGLNEIKKYKPNKLIAFGVGLTPKGNVKMTALIKTNELGDIPFFYYEGGTNPKKMGILGRLVVRMVTGKKIAYKDNSNKEQINKLVETAKKS